MNFQTRLLLVTFFFFLLVLFGASKVWAQSPINKFGIHLAVPSDEDIQKASELVNSNGGEYGYVTVVIHDNQLDTPYWQSIFDKFRRLKLIPIIRLATHPEGEVWRAPLEEDATRWADFLASLNWVTKERYVILFNETNHASEWGGGVDASAFGRVAYAHSKALKDKSKDFFIMLGGLDLSAPEAKPNYADAYWYLKEASSSFCNNLSDEKDNCKDYIDGIASHSYPNPGFVGSPNDSGRRSIRGYESEIVWFREFFGDKDFPVFITETGWDSSRISHSQVATNFEYAFSNIWLKDDRVKAVTPFILNYQGSPFLGFSLLELETLTPKLPFLKIQSLAKLKGNPERADKAQVKAEVPLNFVELDRVILSVKVKNEGQSIWGEGNEYILRATSGKKLLSGQVNIPGYIEPFQKTHLYLPIYTQDIDTDTPDNLNIDVIKMSDEVAGSLQKPFILHTRPSLKAIASILSRGLSSDSDFELQIFDTTERLVYRKRNAELTLGNLAIASLSSVVPGEKYRFVLLKPYYLPRQVIKLVSTGENRIEFEELIPLDFDRDGALSIGDVQGLFVRKSEKDKNFWEKISLLFPSDKN